MRSAASTRPPRTRGQPLVVLMALLIGWVGARVTSLDAKALSLPETMLARDAPPPAIPEAESRRSGPGPQSYPLPEEMVQAAAYSPPPSQGWYGPPQMPARWAAGPYGPVVYLPGPPPRRAYPRGYAQAYVDPPRFFGDFPQDRPIAPIRQEDAMPPRGLPPLHAGSPTPPPSRYGEGSTLLGGRLGRLMGDRSRWSMDAWALFRQDGAQRVPAGTLPATYGASQAGAVLRYRIARDDPRRPSAYLRSTSTLGTLNETSVALGLSARPLGGVPVVAAIEGRLVDQAGLRRVQPAAMLVTEIPPLALPGSLRAEMYGQGGYVGGKFATPFADGQVRVDRRLLSKGRYEARIGAGAWGGIQKGASRLDAGPGATLSMPLTPKVAGRLALDWRFRVAGNAQPDSGPALTVAAGF